MVYDSILLTLCTKISVMSISRFRMGINTIVRVAAVVVLCCISLKVAAEASTEAKAETQTEANTEANTKTDHKAKAEVRLPAVISDGMLIQRDEPFTVWGWAEAGESFGVCWQDAQTWPLSWISFC